MMRVYTRVGATLEDEASQGAEPTRLSQAPASASRGLRSEASENDRESIEVPSPEEVSVSALP